MALSIRGSADEIADTLRSEIASSVVKPGAILNQVELAQRFELSRIPVREALRRLEAEGYVVYRTNKGATVAWPPTPTELLEILEIRECLELRMMECAVRDFGADLHDRSAKAMREMNGATSEAQLRGLHERFHTLLYQAAQRPYTAGLINTWRLRLVIDRHRSFVDATRGVHQQLLMELARKKARAVAMCVREEYRIIRALVVDDS